MKQILKLGGGDYFGILLLGMEHLDFPIAYRKSISISIQPFIQTKNSL